MLGTLVAKGAQLVSNSHEGLDRLRTDILAGHLSRRDVLKRSIALGLSAPIVAGLLAACGGDDDDDAENTPAAAAPTATTGGSTAAEPTATTAAASGAGDPTATTGSAAAEPTATEAAAASPEATATEAAPAAEAGGGGLLRLLWWQAPTIINPHLSTGTKDFDASRVCYEPLADIDKNGDLVPYLAAEVPSLENGGVAEDGSTVTWKLREGVTWHDGEDFTAEDVVFTWEYAANPDTSAVSAGVFANVAGVEAVDDYTVLVSFVEPTPAWYDVFTGPYGMILPQHVFADFIGTEASNAPANLEPIGTGPFMVSEFRAGDVVLYDRYEGYWDAGKPYFDSVEMKGGGDAIGAARGVVQSGEADWAWNIQAEPAILAEMESDDAPGQVNTTEGVSAERLMIQFADPNVEVEGARSEPSTQHPIFQHKEVRNALALAIQRDVIAEQLYGPGGQATANNLNAPARFRSPNTTWEFNLEAAAELLAGFPETQGYNLLYQTSINSVRQKTQEIIKADFESLGFSVELKSVDAAVFFASDPGNPDTYPHFYSDLEMYTNGPSSPYPIVWAERYRSDDIAQKSNEWRGQNVSRWNNPDYDALHDQGRLELDPAVQEELFHAMNDLSVNEFVEIPIIWRNGVTCVAKSLENYNGSPWASDVWDIANWTRSE